jgi:hypothetical protein
MSKVKILGAHSDRINQVLTNVQPVEIQGTCYSYQFIAIPDLKALFQTSESLLPPQFFVVRFASRKINKL